MRVIVLCMGVSELIEVILFCCAHLMLKSQHTSVHCVIAFDIDIGGGCFLPFVRHQHFLAFVFVSSLLLRFVSLLSRFEFAVRNFRWQHHQFHIVETESFEPAHVYTRNSRRNRTTIKPRNGTISENPIRNNSTPFAKRERKRDTGSAGADLKIMAIVYRSVALSHLLTGFISLTPHICIHKLFHIVLADGYNNQISLNTKARLIWIQIELMK